jgi:hypothetical protein
MKICFNLSLGICGLILVMKLYIKIREGREKKSKERICQIVITEKK